MSNTSFQAELKNFGVPHEVIKAIQSNKFGFLREIQRKTLEKGLLDDKSFLVISPSGSGKTLIGHIAVLNTIFKYKAKALYLVPLRALANEKYYQFSKQSSGLKVKIILTMGDQEINTRDLYNADLYIMTFEKFDAYLRNNPEVEWIQKIKTIIIDEIHIVGDNHRGPRLENLILRIYNLKMPPQLVCLSATIGNPTFLTNWFSYLEQKFRNNRLEEVRDATRPTPLHHKILVTKNKLEVMTKIVGKTLENNGQVLIFTNSRVKTELFAKQISSGLKSSKWINFSQNLDKFFHSVNFQMNEVDTGILNQIEKGVGFYHAGLNSKERLLLEEAFKKDIIKVLITTTSLSAGINLPARAVIIQDFYLYHIKTSEIQINQKYSLKYDKKPLNRNLFHQICGRAGRPGFDPIGYAYVLTESTEEKFFIQDHYFTQKNSTDFIPKYDNITSCLNLNHDMLLETVLLNIYETNHFLYLDIIDFIQNSLIGYKLYELGISINSYLNIFQGDLLSLLKTFAEPNYLHILGKSSISIFIGYFSSKSRLEGIIQIQIPQEVYSQNIEVFREFSPKILENGLIKQIERNFIFNTQKQNFCSCNDRNKLEKSQFPHLVTETHPLGELCFGKIAVLYAFMKYISTQTSKLEKIEFKMDLKINHEKFRSFDFDTFFYKSIYPISIIEELEQLKLIKKDNPNSSRILCTELGKIALRCYISPRLAFDLSECIIKLEEKGTLVNLKIFLPALMTILKNHQISIPFNYLKIITLWIEENQISRIISYISREKGTKPIYTNDIISFLDKLARNLKFIRDYYIKEKNSRYYLHFQHLYYRVKYGIKQDLIPWAKLIQNRDIHIYRNYVNLGISTPEKLINISEKKLSNILQIPLSEIKKLKNEITQKCA
jgi:helicase